MEINHVAMLARLELTEEEKETFSMQVNDVIKYINKLDELNTADIEPTAHVVPMKNVFREDEIRDSLPKEKALQNAPRRTDDFYTVPKIIE